MIEKNLGWISGKDSCQGDSGGPLMKLVIEPGKEPYYEWIGINYLDI